jgi:hypothetical protein
MAIINAANNGNWSNSNTWPSGIFPTVLDDVYANNRTIYIDQNISVYSLNTTAGTGGTAGGRFYANQGDRIINANIIQAGTTYCVTVTGTGTRTISSQFIEGSDTTNTTAAILIQGTSTALPNVVTYGSAVGGLASGGGATSTPSAITIEGGILTHYGFVSGGGGQATTRSTGIKIYQAASSTIPVSAIIYGNVKGGTNPICTGITCEFSPAATTLSSCLISIYGNLSGGDSLLTATTNNAGLYTNTTIHTEVSGNIHGGSGFSYTNGGIVGFATTTLDVNIVGNVYNHNSFGFCPGISYSSTSGNINITGDVVCLDSFGGVPATNSINSYAIYQNGGTALNILGNVYGCRGLVGFANGGIYLDSTNVTSITGNVYGGNTGNSYGIYVADSPNIVNIYGNVYGNTVGRGIGGHGIYINSGTARVNIYGSAIGSENDNTSWGVRNNSTGVVYAKRVVANSFGVGSGGVSDNPNYGVGSDSISGRNLVEELVFGPRGQIPVFGPTYIVKETTNSATIQTFDVTKSNFYQEKKLVDDTIINTFLPKVSDVRSNVVYDSLTGTMIVPAPSSVNFEIPVDNTQGTAYLTPNILWNTQTTELTSLSTVIGYRMNNIATVETVGNTLASYNI